MQLKYPYDCKLYLKKIFPAKKLASSGVHLIDANKQCIPWPQGLSDHKDDLKFKDWKKIKQFIENYKSAI